MEALSVSVVKTLEFKQFLYLYNKKGQNKAGTQLFMLYKNPNNTASNSSVVWIFALEAKMRTRSDCLIGIYFDSQSYPAITVKVGKAAAV
ncbi:hypothetical protein [Terribacillus sp. DMT04]|uniref:hypothetical protein n=1 Tax=Terribacillus sp. DMT04 TaxID=2850441 RepID=UPI001C2C7AF8|nr:hypothetical protein [Terribacillus sp. DMT04]QXE00703.1 hypothetical protein KS242_11825 [Terribacillus sp. DMT04]